MKIVACLAWYMEPLPFLDRLVRSLAGHVDALVAVDGPWEGFPGPVTSGRDERDTIRAAAAEADLRCRVVSPTARWRSQVAKRAEVFRLAVEEHSADWLFVTDGDTFIESCDDVALRKSLILTDRDVCSVSVTNLNRAWPLSEMPSNTVPQRHLFRASAGLTYRRAHDGVVTADGRWLSGNPWLTEPALDLSRVVAVSHDNRNRGELRELAAVEYRRWREERGVESWKGAV